MNDPKANFHFYPLSGKAPLTVNFINNSENVGGLDEWSICPITKKYHISHLNSSSDVFALDFSEFSGEGIKQTYNENGFKLESTGAHYYNVEEGKSTTIIKPDPDIPEDLVYPINNIDEIIDESPLDQINVDLNKDFYIEMTIVEFKNSHGSIQLYFEDLPSLGSLYDVGIHINTNFENGSIRGLTNAGSNLSNLNNFELPVKVKLSKIADLLKLYINDTKITESSASTIGVGKKTGGDFQSPRNLLCPLKLKISTQNNVSNWSMHIKDIYVVTNIKEVENYIEVDNNSNLPNIGLGHYALFDWSFDDGSISSEEEPTHVFNYDGPHNVILNMITENGVSTVSKKIIILPNDNPLPDAGNIFNEKNIEVVRDLDSIPDYCSNDRLKNIINAAIYDSIRHADTIQDSITTEIKLTLDKTEDNNRNIRCETCFISDLYQDTDTNNEHVFRTLVEKEKQNDVIDIIFELPDPE